MPKTIRGRGFWSPLPFCVFNSINCWRSPRIFSPVKIRERAPFNLTPIILLSFKGEGEDIYKPLTKQGKRPDFYSVASVKKGAPAKRTSSEPPFLYLITLNKLLLDNKSLNCDL
jgi:hypothetical protein